MNRCETSDSNNTKQKQKMEIKSITKQSIEALGDFLEYKEIKRVFSSLFSTNEKGFKESPGIGFGCTQDRPGRRV